MLISIHQPHYLPTNQYFDKIKRSEVFVFLDNVQFEKNGWQNRNRIKNKEKIQWLTVPIKHRFGQLVKDVEIDGSKWIKKHINTIEQTFKCSKKWEWKIIKEILEKDYKKLSDLNCELIKTIAYNILKVKTMFVSSSCLKIEEDNPDDRIIKIVKKLKGTEYLTGIGGKSYMDLEKYPKHFRVVFQDNNEKEPLSILHRIL